MQPRLLLLAAVLAVLGATLFWLLSGTALRDAPPQQVLAGAGPRDAAAANGGDVGSRTDPPPAVEPAAPQRAAVAAATPGVAGRLLQDDRPLPGVELRAFPSNWSAEEVGRGATDAEGAFFLPLPAGRHRLELRGAGVPRGYSIRPVTLVPGEHRDLGDFAVPRSAAITGRVVDQQGQPLAGARVFARSSGSIVDRFRIDVVDPTAAEADPSALTGPDGAFAIGGLGPGTLYALAEHPDCQSWTAEVEVAAGGRGSVGDIVLRAAAALRGVVCDQHGAAIAGARVTPGGGRFDPLHPRQRVLTAGDGGFVLRGFGNRSDFTIEREGFETQVHNSEDRQPQPVRIVLAPALVLAGTVCGNDGQTGTLQLASDPESYRGWGWVDAILRGPHPVATDGSFRVVGLPAGNWMVGAVVPGVGSAAPVRCTLPQQAPLELQLVADLEVAVRVVDDRGVPVARATLARAPATELSTYNSPTTFAASWLQWPNREEQTADAEGEAVVRLPRHEALQLAASAPGHLVGAIAMAPGAVPAAATIALVRAGAVHGRIADTSLLAHVRVAVHFARAEAADQGGAGVAVDRSGHFRSPPLSPGSYRVTLHLADATAHSGYDLPLPRPVPLLGDYEPVSEAVLVEIEPGVDTGIALPAPVCGEVQGRVLAGGAAVADAIVFGRNAAEKLLDFINLDDPDACDYFARCRTDAAGRFRFLVGASGSYELRARHRLGARWSEPIGLQLSPGASVQRDIVLQAAAIRGSFDVGTIAPADRQFFTAQLYPLQQAGSDPFYFSEWSISQEFRVQKAPLGKTGSFAFECLPPGGYVLRLVNRLDHILLTRVLHTVGDEVLDLGALEPPECVAPKLACGLQEGFGVWVRQPAPGSEDGVFVRTLTRRGQEAIAWGELAPGRYRLLAFRIREDWGLHSYGSSTGEAVGAPVEVEVHADGSCTPAVVWPDGVAK